MQKITAMGRITKDVELGHSQSGNAFARFPLAVDRRTRKDEEKKTDFFDCVAFGNTAEFINKYFGKGSGILVVGRMESNKWEDKEGNKRLSWSLMIDEAFFPLGKSKNSSDEEPEKPAYAGTSVSEQVANRNAQQNSTKSYVSTQPAPQAYYQQQTAWEPAEEADLPF